MPEPEGPVGGERPEASSAPSSPSSGSNAGNYSYTSYNSYNSYNGGDWGSPDGGVIHISEDVIVELARKTIQGIPNIQPANTRKFGIGRRGSDGIRISVEPAAGPGAVPSVLIDIYVLVRYGQRIPDLAWDVQEKVKTNLERYTGYAVKAVNINVQGIYLEEPPVLREPDTPDDSHALPEDADEGQPVP